MTATALIGREREVRELTGLIDEGSGRGQSVLLIGDPGIGKSALLAAAEEKARSSGFSVLTATGVQSEAQLPFAGLHQLLRPVLDSADRPATCLPDQAHTTRPVVVLRDPGG